MHLLPTCWVVATYYNATLTPRSTWFNSTLAPCCSGSTGQQSAARRHAHERQATRTKPQRTPQQTRRHATLNICLKP